MDVSMCLAKPQLRRVLMFTQGDGCITSAISSPSGSLLAVRSRPQWGASSVSDSFVRPHRLSSKIPYIDGSIAGIFSATPLALGGGSVADLFAEQDRASAMAM